MPATRYHQRIRKAETIVILGAAVALLSYCAWTWIL